MAITNAGVKNLLPQSCGHLNNSSDNYPVTDNLLNPSLWAICLCPAVNTGWFRTVNTRYYRIGQLVCGPTWTHLKRFADVALITANGVCLTAPEELPAVCSSTPCSSPLRPTLTYCGHTEKSTRGRIKISPTVRLTLSRVQLQVSRAARSLIPC